MIKAIIFDLDNTLYDAELVKARQFNRVKDALRRNLNDNEIQKLEEEFKTKNFLQILELIKNKFGEKMAEEAKEIYFNVDLNGIKLFDDVIETLKKLNKHFIKILVTQGTIKNQKEKVMRLGLSEYFDKVYYVDDGDNKEIYFKKVLNEFNLLPREVIAVGDTPYREIKMGKELGMHTVQFLHGKFANTDTGIEPDYKIKKISEIPSILKNLFNQKEQRKDE